MAKKKRKKPKGNSRKMLGVYRAVTFVYYGLYLTVVGFLVGVVGSGIACGSINSGSSGGFSTGMNIVRAAGIMIPAGAVLGFVGRIMSLDCPEDFSGKKLIYGAVFFDVIVITLRVMSWFTTLRPIVETLSQLSNLAATILFLVFLKQVAQYIHDAKSEGSAANVLKIGLGVFVSMLLGIFLPPLFLLAILLLLIGFLAYIMLLIRLRESLQTA